MNVIPMDRERVLPNQTVIVRDGTIETIGYTKRMKLPPSAQVVDGTDKFPRLPRSATSTCA